MGFLAEHWGDIASVVGLVLTIWTLTQARAAVKAVEQVKSQMSALDTLAEVSAAITLLGEVKTLQRLGAWDLVMDRYGLLRRQLVRIEKLHDGMQDEHRVQLAEALSQFRIIEKKIDTARSAGLLANMDSAKFNEIVSKRIETLESLMIAIKKAGV